MNIIFVLTLNYIKKATMDDFISTLIPFKIKN